MTNAIIFHVIFQKNNMNEINEICNNLMIYHCHQCQHNWNLHLNSVYYLTSLYLSCYCKLLCVWSYLSAVKQYPTNGSQKSISDDLNEHQICSFITVISREQEGASVKNFSPTGLNNFQPLGLKNHALRLSIHDFRIVMKYQ